MTYSLKKNDQTLKEMIEHFGIENIPNPENYPMCFEFLFSSFEHYKKIQNLKEETR